MITILIFGFIIYGLLQIIRSSKNKKDFDNNQQEKETRKSWFERNILIISVSIAIFILHLCNDLSR